jgi:signal peptidase
MKKTTYKEKLIIIAILLFLVVYKVLQLNYYQVIAKYLNIFFWLILLIISYYLIGYNKCRKMVKKETVQVVLIGTMSYMIITYLLGLTIGYSYTPFSLKLFNIIKNIVPFIIYTISREIVRYILIHKTDNKCFYATTIVYSLIDIVVMSASYDFSSIMSTFEFVGVGVLGSIFKNILLSYMSKNAGIVPTILYLLVMEGYIYLVAFVPNLGEYLSAMFLVAFPTILLIILNKIYDREEEPKRKKKSNIYFSIPFILLLLLLIALVSGIFKYKVYAVASNSMYPKLVRGDAVIIEKYSNASELEVGNIIAFIHDKKVYVHRIAKIKKYNNELYYITKGDNNSINDDFDITTDDIVGVVKFRIPYIGYPTVWLSEALE